MIASSVSSFRPPPAAVPSFLPRLGGFWWYCCGTPSSLELAVMEARYLSVLASADVRVLFSARALRRMLCRRVL